MEEIKKQYGGDWNEKYLYFFGIALATFLITTNIMALKFFEVAGVKFGAGMLFFPFCLITGDIVTEVYGFRKTRQIIIASLLAYMFFMLSSQLVVALPPASEWSLQESFEKIFKQAPRVFVAGCLAYLAGELSNYYVMAKLKAKTDGKHFWYRAMMSTVVGQTANTFVFQFIAFLGVMPTLFLAKVVVNGTIMKVLIEAVILPGTYLICRKLKAIEGVDYFDFRSKS
jgi:uncharacterized integral membrane protein (TIGR00697 family)